MTRRNGIIRAGPDERLRTERERERQRQCRNRKRTAAALHKRVVQEDIRERENSSSFGARLNQRLVRRDAKEVAGRKEVVKHWIAPGVRERHHCQYLLKSQVCFPKFM